MQGCDSASPLGDIAASLTANGLRWVGRYYSHDADSNPKNLSPGEVATLVAAGLLIVSVFEADPTYVGYFTPDQGTKDAARALDLAQKCGQPALSVIYFTVDYDASADDIVGAIVPYFSAVKAAVGSLYRLGAYGSGAVLDALKTAGLAEYFWLADSLGWSGSSDFSGADIQQKNTTSLSGVGIDLDEALTVTFGGWDTVAIVSPDPVPPSGVVGIIPSVRVVQAELARVGLYKARVDGDPGPLTIAALKEYWRRRASG